MTIYDSIGGAPAVSAAVDDFYVRVLADPTLAPFFDGVDVDRVKAHQRKLIAAAVGGSEIYAGRDMKEAHLELPITSDNFDQVVHHLVATLTGLGVPDATIVQIGGALAPLKPDIVNAE